MNLDEDKSKHARLAQQNGSGPASLYSLAKAGERFNKA
jgi:hypothetical protein